MKSLSLVFVMCVFAASAWGAAPDGAKNFGAKCASCHGKDGKGNAAMSKVFKVDPSALDLTDKATLDKTDADLDAVTAKGFKKMPAYAGKMTEAEIAALTAHVRTLGAAKTIEKTPPGK
jgi:cytochrome c6